MAGLVVAGRAWRAARAGLLRLNALLAEGGSADAEVFRTSTRDLEHAAETARRLEAAREDRLRAWTGPAPQRGGAHGKTSGSAEDIAS